ncbi:PepSY-associated TM helix domain-containing protein, partial [Streptomyces alkaliphilus]|uniref:PepSY-associated TM helix domain-containing protein n=1 Tax=Streptomyces alkaliphilus TaxID=1472722 RepID=UPI00117EEA90
DPPPTSSGASAPAGRTDRAGRSDLRPLLLRMHFYAGLLVAPFLLVAAVTGLLYAGSLPAERLVYAEELRTTPADTRVPLEEQVDAALAAHPEGTVSAVRVGENPGDTTRVLLTGTPGLTEGRTLAVFVDPHTAEVRGALEQYGTSGALPLRTWVSGLHGNLHLGDPGRLYAELAASWLIVLTVGGLIMWLARKGGRRPGARGVLVPERRARGRRRTLSLHAAVGVWASLGLLILAVTGLTWSTYAGGHISDLRTALNQTTPSVSAALPNPGAEGDHDGHGDHGDHGDHGHGAPAAVGGSGWPAPPGIGPDGALAAAGAAGLDGPLEIVPPADPESTWVVKEMDRQWPIRLDAVAVHPHTGDLTDRLDFADQPPLAKLTRWGIDIHSGFLFGLANQIVLMALAGALVMLIVWGYRMWWLRGRASAFGRPIPRGAWRRARPWQLIVAGLVLAALGWYVPLIGVPLVAFLVIDAVVGAVLRRRGGARSAGDTAVGAPDAPAGEDPEITGPLPGTSAGASDGAEPAGAAPGR